MAFSRTAALLIPALMAAVASASRVRVAGDRVNLRPRPEETVEVVGQVMAGQELTAPDGIQGEWVRVVPPDEVSLWIYGELVRDGRVTVDKAQVRGGPGLQYKNVGMLARGAAVEVRGQLGEWLKIRPPEGTSLWVSAAYVELLDAPPEAAAAAVAAIDPADPALETDVAPPPAAVSHVPPTIPASPANPPPPPELPAPADLEPVVRSGMLTTPLVADLPDALAGYGLDALRPQGSSARFTGLLQRSPRLPGRPSPYQIVQQDRSSRPMAVCHVVGFEGQLDALIGSAVSVRGRTWYLAGMTQPALQPDRLVRVE